MVLSIHRGYFACFRIGHDVCAQTARRSFREELRDSRSGYEHMGCACASTAIFVDAPMLLFMYACIRSFIVYCIFVYNRHFLAQTVLAVGAYGEVSESVMDLVATAAGHGAARMWSVMGCKSEADARSVISADIMATIGTAVVTAQARLLSKQISQHAMPTMATDNSRRAVAARCVDRAAGRSGIGRGRWGDHYSRGD